MNQSSIDCGIFCSLFFCFYMDCEKWVGINIVEMFEKLICGDMLRLKYGMYDKLDVDGIIVFGICVLGEDIIIGKMLFINFDNVEFG